MKRLFAYILILAIILSYISQVPFSVQAVTEQQPASEEEIVEYSSEQEQNAGNLLTSISISTIPYKTTYLCNEEFLDVTGGVVTLTYSDGTTATVPMTNEMVTGFDNTKSGEQTLTVTCEGKTATYSIALKEVMDLYLTSAPTKKVYLLGKEGVDLTGGILLVLYNDGTNDAIALTEDMVSGFDNTVLGPQTVTIHYGSCAVSYEITIVESLTVSEISIKQSPAKVTYLMGLEDLDVSGGQLLVKYDDNTTEVISFTQEMVSGFDNSIGGNQVLTVVFGGLTVTYTITVQEENLTDFAAGFGTKEYPYVIETEIHLRNIYRYPSAHYILANDIVLENKWERIASFSGVFNGNKHTISGFIIDDNDDGYVSSAVYVGLFSKNSGEIFDLSISGNIILKKKNHVLVGAICGENTGTISGCHSNVDIDATAQCIAGWDRGGYHSEGYNCYVGGIAGYSTGTITNCYSNGDINGKSQDMEYATNVHGIGHAYVAGIACGYGETFTSYHIGSISATAYTASYENEYAISPNYENCYANLGDLMLRQSTYDGFDFDTVWHINPFSGYLYPQFTWQTNKLVDIWVEEAPKTSVEVVYGVWPENSGVIVGGRYADGTMETTELNVGFLEQLDINTVGQQTVQLTTGNLTTSETITFQVIPVAPEKLEIITLPDKVDYVQYWDELRINGGKILLTNNDGSTETADISYDMITGFDDSLCGQQTITVTYKGLTTQYIITVHSLDNETTGSCGDNAIWTFNKTQGKLTISGAGEVALSEDRPPWYLVVDHIKSIVVSDAITKLPAGIFAGCGNLTQITLPFVGEASDVADDVYAYRYPLGFVFGTNEYYGSKKTKQIYLIGSSSSSHTNTANYYIPSSLKIVTITGGNISYSPFYDCEELAFVNLTGNITNLPPNAFYGCSKLSSVQLPSSLETIEGQAFAYCSNLKIITIPDSVTSISAGAFFGCSSLESITIPFVGAFRGTTSDAYQYPFGHIFGTDSYAGGVATKQYYYDYNKQKQNNYYIPESLKSVTVTDGEILYGAFYNCTNIQSINIPDSTTGVGDYAFYNCTDLQSVNIPDGAAYIGDCAFYNCTSLRKIEIPGSVTSIGVSAFKGCAQLTGIWVSEKNPQYSNDERGVLFDKDKKTLIQAPSMLAGSYLVPNCVARIEEGAFSGCGGLESITIPFVGSGDGYQSLGYIFGTDSYTGGVATWQYDGSGSRDNYYIPKSLHSVTVTGGRIHYGAFSNCANLLSITIPDSATNIGNYAFEGCSNLTSITIPDSVTNIGNYAFSHCASLQNIEIPDGVTSIGEHAFDGCSRLQSINIPVSVTSVGEYTFDNCTNLTDVYITDLRAWWEMEFQNYANPILCGAALHILDESGNEVTEFVLDESMTEIPDKAFYKCVGLQNIVIPDSVTSIGEDAFYGCVSLQRVEIPDGITSIGDYMFYNCTSLRSIEIPNTVTSIGYEAFYNCTSLQNIVIPDSVTEIGSYALFGCSSLEAITIPFVGDSSEITVDDYKYPFGYIFGTMSYAGGVETKQYYYRYNTSKITSITYYIPASLKSVTVTGGTIRYRAFYNCSSLTSITIGDGIIGIDEYAFEKCTNMTSITIPDSVTSIGDYAFLDCNSLAGVAIGNGLISIGEYAFENCAGLTNITIPDSVTSIGSSAFSGCSSLTSITIPDSVTSIGSSAFSGCSNLTSVTIPDGVASIGRSAFYGCSSLESMTIPFIGGSRKTASDTDQYPLGYIFGTSSYTGGVATEQYYYGYYTDSTTSSTYYIPSSLKSVTVTGGDILYGAFYNCSGLTSITISDGVTSIGNSAFYNCAGLTSITIPDSVTSIGRYAFYNCDGFTSITIPDSVTSIGAGALAGCSNLESITIPFVGDSRKTASDTYQYPFGYIFASSSYASDGFIAQYYYGSSTSETTRSYYYIPSSLKSVTVTGGNILYGAFYNCSSLTSITIPDNVTSIGSYAFYNCDGLTNITIPDSVTSIGSYAFNYCGELDAVFYKGSLAEKANMRFGTLDSSLASATWHYEVTAYLFDGTEVCLCSRCGLVNWDGTKVPLRQLSIITLPEKLRYCTEDTVSLYGISLLGTYSDGLQVNLGADAVDNIAADLSTTGKKIVTITVADATTQFEIVVHESGEILVSSELYPQSSHNYANNENQTKTFTYPGAYSLTVTFDSLTSVESGYDYLYIYDGAGNLIASYTGTAAANQTLTIPGDTFKIKLTSDGSRVYYGYGFSSIIATAGEQHIPIVDPATVTCTQSGLTEGSHCDICGDILVAQEEVAALGHDYETTFTWSEDHTSCTAVVTCERDCGLYEMVDCTVMRSEPNQAQTVHTAVAECDGVKFTDVLTCDNFLITFKDWDGTQITSTYYHAGDTVAAPANPTRAADKAYTYTFAGWDKIVVDCVGDVTYTATYTPVYIDYTVTFKNWDGSILSTKTYHYGDKVTAPTSPRRTEDNTYTYAFKGWDKTVVNCAGNATYTAQYTATYKDYTVTFKNWDGTVLSSETYHYGDKVTAPGNPTKAADNTYTYTFVGWDKAIVNCAGSTTYTATFGQTYIDYTVIFKNWDGSVIATDTYHYGDVVQEPNAPVKESDVYGTYVFSGWDKTVTNCAGNAIYTATFKTEYTDYVVKFQNWNGTVLSSKTYHYGDKVTAPSNPTRVSDNTYTYTFKGWDKAVVDCAGSVTYTATYTPVYINYTIVFEDWDGTVLGSETYHYGDAVTAPSNPTRAADNTYTYAFVGWDKDVVDCIGSVTYIAQYDAIFREYTIVFKNWDGSVISSETYHWDDDVAVPETPTREKDGYYAYIFSGWDKEVGKCSGNTGYQAIFVAEHYHTYGENVTDPTCTEQGYTMHTCACGDSYTDSYVNETGHSYDNACDTSCGTCGVVRSITHAYTTTTTKAALTKDGSIVEKCDVCGHVASSTTIKYVKTISLSATSYTYDGKVKTPTVTVKDANGKALTKDVDYTVSYASGRKNAGTYKVTITMKGNYSGTKTLTFKINPIDISKCSIKLSATSYTYDGKVKTPSVTVKNANGTTLKKDTHYTVSYASGRKSLGAYKVTITMKGNYGGTKTLTFDIKLTAPTVTAANAATGVKVTWNKIAGAKNYTVYRSIYTNGKWSGWTKIKTGVTGTSYTDTSVKSGTTVRYTVKPYNGDHTAACKTGNSTLFLSQATVKATNAATGVKVTWNKITGAKSYVVYRSVYSNGKWSGWTKIKSGVTGTSYTDTGVKSGTTVRYTVKAVNGSYVSICKTGNTLKYLAQPKVTVAKASNGIKASWGKVTGASGYLVYRRTYSNGKWGSWEKIKTTTALNYTDTTAKKGVTYQYMARAYSGDYKSSYTNSKSIKR